jgi:hypothetical protein
VIALLAALALFLHPPATVMLPQERGPLVLFPPYRGPAIPARPWGPIATLESDVQWGANTGNGFYGGLQLSQQFWESYKPNGAPLYAYEATPWQQVYAARGIARTYGFQAWSACLIRPRVCE